jgi:PAS domain S-box-containing protein
MKSPLRVLLLEDDPRDAELVQEKLASDGIACEMTRVETQADFIASLEQGGLDLILADYSLPSFDGLSALKIAQQRWAHVPFIFVSGTLGEEVAIEALTIGATDYVLKTGLARLGSSVKRGLREAQERRELSRAEDNLRRSEAYLAEAQRLSHTGSFGWDVPSGEIYWSRETFRIFGYEPAAKVTIEQVMQRTHPEDKSDVQQLIERVTREKKDFDFEHRLLMPDGSVKFVRVVGYPSPDDAGDLEFVGAVTDITERKRGEALFSGEQRLLKMIATGVALKEILNVLCLIIEDYRSGTLASVLLLHPDGIHLDSVAGPSLPKGWTQQMEKLPIGPCAGSCGTAAYRGSAVMVSDLATDPLWDVPEHRAAALSHGLHSSWSNPILSSEGKVLGTFCLYGREPQSPTSKDLEVIEKATDLARVAIERDRAVDALRRNETHLEEAQRLSKTGSFVWNAKTKENAFWSKQLRRIYGFDPETPIAQYAAARERVHPEDGSAFDETFDRALRERRDFEIDHRIVLPGGEVKHIHVVGHPVLNGSGDLVEYVGTVMDLTESKRAAEALREQANLLDLTHDTIFVRDTNDIITYWNRGAEERYGWSSEEAVGRVSHALIKTSFHAPLQEINAQLLETGRWEGELIHTRRDGTAVTVASRWALQRDESGNPVAILETNNDITERRQAEGARRQSEEKYRDLINASPDAICVIDADGIFILVNPAAVKLAGRPEDELIGSSLADTYLPAERHLLEHRIEKLKAEGSFRFERKFVRENGEVIPVEVSLAALRGRYYQSIIRDISQRKRREALLAGENRVLEMVAKGDSLPDILDTLCRLVEEQSSGVLASILLMDSNGKQLRHGAAPNLPKAYTAAIDGLFIGHSVGSCGTAAYRAEQVIVSDIATDPLWAPFRELALPHALRACWSTPIVSSEGKVTGTFAMYYREPRSPSPSEQDTIKHITHLAGVAIQRKMAETARRESEAYLAEAQRLSHTGSWAWAPATGEIRYWSEETYRVLGFDPEAGPPRFEKFFGRFCREDQERVRELFGKAIAQKADFETDYRIVHPNGDVKDIHAVGHPVSDEAGRFVEFVGTVIDITESKRAEEALRASEQVARGQVEALAQSLDVLATAPEPEKFIGQMLSTIGRLLNAESVTLWLLDKSADSLVLRSMAKAGELIAPDPDHPFMIDPSFWKQNAVIRELLFTAGPVVCDDLETDPRVNGEWGDYLKRHGTRRFMAVPILMAGEVRGFVGIRHVDLASYRPEEIELTQALAHQVMLAIQLNEFAEQGQRAAVFEERNRMARNIHDTLAQGFTGVIVQLEAAEDAISCGSRKEADAHLHRAGQLARESLSEARRSVHALRPRALETHNFWDALKGTIKNTTVGTALHTKFAAQGKLPALPPAWQENLLHIGQEALTNTLKYAHARNFETRLSYKAKTLRLELRDDGDGFKIKDRSDGVGLTGMRERVEQMGGTLTLKSQRGKGTNIVVVLPCQEQAML